MDSYQQLAMRVDIDACSGCGLDLATYDGQRHGHGFALYCWHCVNKRRCIGCYPPSKGVKS